MVFIHLEIIGEEKYIYLKKNLQKFLQFGEVTWRNQSVLGFIKLALLILVIHIIHNKFWFVLVWIFYFVVRMNEIPLTPNNNNYSC